MLPHYIRLAHECHDRLVERGGRPTRKVLEEPTGKAVYEKDEIRIFDDHGELQFTASPDADLTVLHWTEEWAHFREELERWTEFKEYQSTMKEKPLLKTTFDPETTDQNLMILLNRLNDWRQFQDYQQEKVGHAARQIRRCARHIEKILRQEDVSDAITSNSDIEEGWRGCHACLFFRHEKLDSSQKQLTLIESQISEVILEACVWLKDDVTLQWQLETKLEQQAKAIYQDSMNLEAGPCQPQRSPPESAGSIEKICYWGLETTRLMEEHWAWKIFLRWRQNHASTEKLANIDQESSRQSSDLQLWVDYVAYRRYGLDISRNWVVGWQRLLKSQESRREATLTDQEKSMLEVVISETRADVKKFQEDVQIAETRVRSAEQLLDKLSYDRTKSQDAQQSSKDTQLQPSPPRTESPEKLLRERGIEEEGVDSSRNLLGSAEDVLMVDVEDSVNAISPSAPGVDISGRGTRAHRASPLSIHQVPTSRETRSTTNLHRTISSTVPKHVAKKPVKRAKKSTDPSYTRPLRRSQRLKDKAAARSPGSRHS